MNIFKNIRGKSKNVIIRRDFFNKLIKDLNYYKHENNIFFKFCRDEYERMLDESYDTINKLEKIIKDNKLDSEDYYYERFKLVEAMNRHGEIIYYKEYESGAKTRIKKSDYIKLKESKNCSKF